MKIFRSGFFFMLVTGITFFHTACDTKEDTEYPEISITQPLQSTIYENGDSIDFQAFFSDNIRLQSVEVTLVDPDNKPMSATISQTPGKNLFTFQGEYPINDPMLPGGIYQLRFRATDGTNVTNKFVRIQIHELEKKMLYPVIVTQNDPNNWQAYRLTGNSQWKEFHTHSGDYIGSAINSATAQFYMCGAALSNLTAVKLPDGTPVWSIKPGTHQSQRWFEGITFSYPDLYISCAEGNIRCIDNTGKEISKTDSYSNAIPRQVVITNNYIIGSFTDVFSTSRYLITFHNPGGLQINQKFIESDIVALLHTKGDKALVLSNKNNQGEISIYNGTDNTLALLHPFYEGTLHMAEVFDTDNFLISTSQGLYRYQLSNNSLTPFVSKIANGIVVCDNTSGLIYVSYEKKLEVYSFPFASLIESINLPDTAVNLHLVFNK